MSSPTSILAGIKAHRDSLAAAGALTPPDAEPAEEVAESAAAEAPPEEVAEPVAEPEDAPDEPEVAAASDQPEPSESEPPSEETQQAAATTTEDDLQHAFKLAGGDSVEALAATVKKFNQRTAELGRAKKELEARVKELEGKQAPPVAPPPATAPAASVPAVATLAPPAPSTPESEVETRVRESMSQDAEAWNAANEYRQSQDRLTAILSQENGTGRLIGELPTVVHKLHALRAQTPEGATALGLRPAPEFEQDDIKSSIRELEREERDLKREQVSLRSISTGAKGFLQQRKTYYEGKIQSERSASQAEADGIAAEEREAVEFADDHTKEFDSIVKEMKLDGPEHEAFRARVWNHGLAELTISNDARLAAKADLRAYLRGNVEKEQQYVGSAKRTADVERAKAARTLSRPEAPRGAKAVATPETRTGQPDDWKIKLRTAAKKIYSGSSA